MEYLPQNASGLYLDIQKIGCFFRSALNLAERKAQKSLTVSQINDLWSECKSLGYIGKLNGQYNCVLNSAKIATRAAEVLKLKGRFVEVGIMKEGIISFYKGVTPETATDFIQKIKQGGPSKTHFRVVAQNGSLLWEPHNPEIKSLGEIYTICYQFREST